MSTTSFDKPFLDKLRLEIEQALKPVAEKHGIEVKLGVGRFTEKQYTVKVECSVLGYKKEAETFLAWSSVIGMRKEDLNRVFKLGAHNYSLEGYLPKKKKYPFLALNLDDGKHYCLGEAGVKQALGYTYYLK